MPRQPVDDPITSRGIGLRSSEWAEIDRIADKWNVTPHNLTVMGLRYFMEQLAAGKVETETQPQTTIKTKK